MARKTGRQPAVRVSSAYDMLSFLERHEPGSRERVWMRIPKESRDFIDKLWRASWIPIEHDHWIPDAIVAEFGLDEARQLFRASIPAMVEKPLLEPLVSGMLRVLGTRRRRILTIIPKGWSLVFRDFCEPSIVTSSDRELEILFDAIPRVVRAHPVYFTMWEGVMLGFLDFTHSDGEIDFELAPDASRVRVRFRWPDDSGS